MKKNLVPYSAFILSVVLSIWSFVVSARLAGITVRLDAQSDEIQKLRKESDYNAEWRSMVNPKLLNAR